MIVRTGIGQDSHRFLAHDASKPCVIAGVIFEDVPGFQANSDGDAVFHAICNAISSLSGVKVLGGIADEMLEKDGITDSSFYLKVALKSLAKQTISHLAVSIEAKRPRFGSRTEQLRQSIAENMGLKLEQVGLTATSGEGLTDFGCGEGIQVLCVLTTIEV